MEKQGYYDKERRLNPMEYAAREEYLTECLKNDLIEEASTFSKYSIAWVVTGNKKDMQGEWTDKRCCLDARRINAMSQDNNHRSQTLDQIFGHMKGAKFCQPERQTRVQPSASHRRHQGNIHFSMEW